MLATKKKLAVLGGGMGSLSAVCAITSRPGWEERYDITVYQLGWRLGGKAATGRDLSAGGRIDEHGYHTLFGFYENTFALMRAVYDEWERDESLPISRFIAEDPGDEERYPDRYALHREDWFLMMQQLADGRVHTFPLEFPRNTDLPGNGSPLPSPLAYIEMAIELLLRILEDVLDALDGGREAAPAPAPGFWQRLTEVAPHIAAGLDPRSRAASSLSGTLRLIRKVAHDIVARAEGGRGGVESSLGLGLLADMIRGFLKVLWFVVKGNVRTSWDSFLAWTSSDFIGTCLIGMIEDDVLSRGFDSIDGTNFWQWLARHATVPEGTRITNGSMWVAAAYDSSFAYLHGDTTTPPGPDKPPRGNPSMGAGTMLRGGMRLMLTYKGAMAWKFQTGTAEALCTPAYEVLKRRGVKFELFRKVEGLSVGQVGERQGITKIRIQRQVKLKDPVRGYDPFVVVKGVQCWPSAPLWDQIEDGEALSKHNLESAWTDWPGVGTDELVLGEDFDEVLLGISIGAFPAITRELMAASPAWKRMVESVLTVRTEALQTWMTKDLRELGWTAADAPVNLGLQPFDTWADMVQLVAREDWPSGNPPASVQYFCSAMADDPNEPVPPDPAYPPTQAAVVLADGRRLLEDSSWRFWPGAQGAGGFDWSTLYTTKGEAGPARLAEQLVRANIDPTERYVLSVPGSVGARMKAVCPDFANLYLAGDWTLSGLNVGCMEATVMSGLQASRAIAGYPERIPGEADWDTGR